MESWSFNQARSSVKLERWRADTQETTEDGRQRGNRYANEISQIDSTCSTALTSRRSLPWRRRRCRHHSCSATSLSHNWDFLFSLTALLSLSLSLSLGFFSNFPKNPGKGERILHNGSRRKEESTGMRGKNFKSCLTHTGNQSPLISLKIFRSAARVFSVLWNIYFTGKPITERFLTTLIPSQCWVKSISFTTSTSLSQIFTIAVNVFISYRVTRQRQYHTHGFLSRVLFRRVQSCSSFAPLSGVVYTTPSNSRSGTEVPAQPISSGSSASNQRQDTRIVVCRVRRHKLWKALWNSRL